MNEGIKAVQVLRTYKKFHDNDLPKLENELKRIEVGNFSEVRAKQGERLVCTLQQDINTLKDGMHKTMEVVVLQNEQVKKFLEDSDVVTKYFKNMTSAIEENLKKNHQYIPYAERTTSSTNASNSDGDNVSSAMATNDENLCPKLEYFVTSNFANKMVLKSPEFPTLKPLTSKHGKDDLGSHLFPVSPITVKPFAPINHVAENDKEIVDNIKSKKLFPKLKLLDGEFHPETGTPLNTDLTKKRFFETPPLLPQTPNLL